MARLPRLFVENCPQHLIQRGNNRDACFYCDADYAFYLQKLKEAACKFQVSIHAFVLMTNHVHLLATPRHFDSLSRMMQSLGRQYLWVCCKMSNNPLLPEGFFIAVLFTTL